MTEYTDPEKLMTSFQSTITEGKETLNELVSRVSRISTEDNNKIKDILNEYDEKVKLIDLDMSKVKERITNMFETNINRDALTSTAQRIRDLNFEFLDWAKEKRLKITEVLNNEKFNFSKWFEKAWSSVKEWTTRGSNTAKEWYTQGVSSVKNWFESLTKKK